ncbi:MAG: hypothetical protein WA738_04700, partial [Candidatus Angelobacter sp.]
LAGIQYCNTWENAYSNVLALRNNRIIRTKTTTIPYRKTRGGPKKGGGLKRPYVRKATRQGAEANAKRTADGKPIDPNTKEPIDGKPDLGHTLGNEQWREAQQREAEGLSQKRV